MRHVTLDRRDTPPVLSARYGSSTACRQAEPGPGCARCPLGAQLHEPHPQACPHAVPAEPTYRSTSGPDASLVRIGAMMIPSGRVWAIHA